MNTPPDLKERVAELGGISRHALVECWVGVFDSTPPARLSTPLMQRAIAHRLQVEALGGIPPRIRTALRHAAQPRGGTPARKLRSGARLVREWNGAVHVVEVVENGFIYRDRRFRSLSSIATEITGAKWSGPRFFGLKARSG